MTTLLLPEIILLSAAAGLVGGFTAGLLGLGGGVVAVPIMNYVLPLAGVPEPIVMHAALVISLATMVYNAGSAAVLRWRAGELPTGLFMRLAPAAIVGALLGAVIADLLTSHTLRIVFVCYVSFVALREIYRIATHADRKAAEALHGREPFLSPAYVTQPYFVLTGAVGSILGVGAALLVVPFFAGAGFSMQVGAAMASAISAVMASIGTVAFVVAGQDAVGMPPYSLGYLYLPAFAGMLVGATIGSPVGVRTAHRLSERTLKGIFLATVALVVVSMVGKLL